MTIKNIILNTDSYKVSMDVQYPAGTEVVFSYIESRGGLHNETVFFGLQAFIKDYLLKPITTKDVDLAEEVWTAHGEPFNRENWDYIVRVHQGKLPVRIKALPEGTVTRTGTAMLTIENTDPKCFWLTTYLETALLRAIWYPTTVATNSREIKKVIAEALDKTGDPAGLAFKLHDFGARGCSSNETAGLGGMAHLINFMGTDTIAGVLAAREFYREPMAGFSIPAAEHSTITSWGRENEVKAYRNMLTKFAKPGALVAVVSDSYDIFNAVTNLWGGELKQEVIDSGAVVIIRPDSGDPATVVLDVLRRADEAFGSEVNAKGYKVLNNVRVIQGDGINLTSITEIIDTFVKAGFSADNVAFGMGGALLQAPQRDDQRFAMKCSAVRVGDTWVDVQKDPITDNGKRSKAGRLVVVETAGLGSTDVQTVTEAQANGRKNILRKVYENGVLLIDDNFTQVRERAALPAKRETVSMYED